MAVVPRLPRRPRSRASSLHGFAEPAWLLLHGSLHRVVVVRRPRPRLVALRQQIAQARRAGCSRESPCPGSGPYCTTSSTSTNSTASTVIAFYAWWARVADWLDRRVWGGVGRLRHLALRPVGAVESLPRHQRRRRQLRQRLRRTLHRRRPAGARAERPRANLPANPGARRRRAGCNSDLERRP